MNKKAKWPKVVGTVVPIFGGTVVLCNTPKQFTDCEMYLTHQNRSDLPLGGVCASMRGSKGDRMYLVGVFDKTIATLAHELAHACFFILGDVGVRVEPGERNETFCYLLSYLLAEQIPHLVKK